VIVLIFPESAVLSDSSSQLSVVPQVPDAKQYAMQVTRVDLKANVPFNFSATIMFKETGYYRVSAYASQKVNNVTHSGVQDTLYLKIGVTESTFEPEPQVPEPSSGDRPPPPSISPYE
jgi:hypothetical protein